jgi:hypothetical protein
MYAVLVCKMVQRSTDRHASLEMQKRRSPSKVRWISSEYQVYAAREWCGYYGSHGRKANAPLASIKSPQGIFGRRAPPSMLRSFLPSISTGRRRHGVREANAMGMVRIAKDPSTNLADLLTKYLKGPRKVALKYSFKQDLRDYLAAWSALFKGVCL